jgi:nucleoside-diphosphate-sugar epimerase
VLDQESKFVAYGAGDVTNYESVAAAWQGASGVIFAASVSGKKKGGDPAHVDYLGVYNTAKACLAADVPRVVWSTVSLRIGERIAGSDTTVRSDTLYNSK